MEIEYFNSMWYKAFGSWLNAENGLAEWGEWVSDSRRRNSAITETLNIYGKRFAEAKDKQRSDYRNNIPTLGEFEIAYFRHCKEQDEAAAIREGRVCGFCGGDGHVWGLVPQKRFEHLAPEHVIEIPDERLPEVYYGVQGYDCPVCRAAAYRDDNYRERVRRNSLPEFLPKGHPDNPHDFDECGARVILAVLKARIEAAKGAPKRVADVPGLDTASRRCFRFTAP